MTLDEESPGYFYDDTHKKWSLFKENNGQWRLEDLANNTRSDHPSFGAAVSALKSHVGDVTVHRKKARSRINQAVLKVAKKNPEFRKALVREIRAHSYFKYQSGMSLQDIIDKWQRDDEKMYDEDYVMIPVRALWPHREYTWTRDTARGGQARVKGKRMDLPGPLKWDAMVDDMKSNGWDVKEPGHFDIGKAGGVKLGEGNHRLAIARKLGIQKAPIQFHFPVGKVTKMKQTKRDPVELSPRSVKKVVEQAIEKPSRKPTPAEDRELENLLKMLM
jgi:hypothetical protein